MSIGTTTAGSAVSAGPAPARKRTRGWRGPLFIAAFVAPALIVYVTLVLLPVALAAVYSFFNWNGLGALERFIGFDNYARALSDPVFLSAISHNLGIVALSLVIQGPLAILIALLLNRPLRGRTLIRTLIFVPYVLSEVVAGLALSGSSFRPTDPSTASSPPWAGPGTNPTGWPTPRSHSGPCSSCSPGSTSASRSS